MVLIFRWGWILGIALLAPIALPAGGGQLLPPHVRFRKSSDPFLTIKSAHLREIPLPQAPSVRSLPVGTPFKILRSWHSSDGKQWIHIRVLIDDSYGLHSFKNGWLDV